MKTYSNKERASGYMSELFQWIKAILFAIFLAIIIRSFVFEPVIVQGQSMEDTLYTDERLIVFKLGDYFHPPGRGDIIVLQYEEGLASKIPLIRDLPFVKKAFPAFSEIDYIKRVVALPGDTVDLKDGHVYLNGQEIYEPFAKGSTYKQAIDFPITVPPGKVFVLGDNRSISRDSRQIGLIEFNRIKGRAVFRIWPIESIGGLK